MNAKEFLIESARGCGLKIIEEGPNHVTLAPLGIYPPANFPKLVGDMSKYGYSFKPTLHPGRLLVYPPEGGFETDIKVLKAQSDEWVITIPWQIVSQLPEWKPDRPGALTPSVRFSPPSRPQPVWAPGELRNSPTLMYVINNTKLERAYGKKWAPAEAPVKHPRKRYKAFKEMGNFLLVQDVNPQGEGTVKLYGLSGDHYHQLASCSVSTRGEANEVFRAAGDVLREGYGRYGG